MKHYEFSDGIYMGAEIHISELDNGSLYLLVDGGHGDASSITFEAHSDRTVERIAEILLAWAKRNKGKEK